MTAEHRGAITEQQEWSGLHRVTGDLVVDGAELRVRCGTMIRVEPGATVRVRSGGHIASEGREGCPVTWTSTAGGDGGRWNGIAVQEGGRLSAQWSTFRYAGRYGAAIHVARGGAASFAGSRIENAVHGGLSVDDGGELATSEGIAFASVAGVPIRVPASEIGAIVSPDLAASAGPIVVHGGLVDTSTDWAFPGHTVELVDDVRVRAELTVTAETRLEFGIGARMVLEGGGTFRARGDERLGYGSAHRYVHLVFQSGSGIDVRKSAGAGNRLEWVLIGGPAAHSTVPIRVAGDRRVEMVDV
ncbi:MAG: hypothetical protein ABEN55_13075, partial [Bradymonadaceae bacterium]